MPNEMRDRLIEILKAPIHPKEGVDPAEVVADYLLDNGVIVPPCKVGDKIYYIDRYSNEVEEDVIKFFTVTQNGVKPILTRHNKKFWDMYEWGKTVFFTREEAEKALAERSENNG